MDVQISYICKAKTIEEVEAVRERIFVSEKLSEDQKKELLMHCDVHHGNIWWDTLPPKEQIEEFTYGELAQKVRPSPRRRWKMPLLQEVLRIYFLPADEIWQVEYLHVMRSGGT